MTQVWPKPIDVKAIRKQVKMLRAEFFRTYGISDARCRNGNKVGDGPARRLTDLTRDFRKNQRCYDGHW
jgi:DNA-binding transcriptional regulator YiaG